MPDKRSSHLHRGRKLNSRIFTDYLIRIIEIINNWIIHGVSSSIILRLLGKNDGFETSFGLVLLVACFFFNFYSVLISSDSLICLLRRLSIYRNGLTHHTQVDFMRKVSLVSQPFYSFLQENLDCMRAQNQFALLSRKSVDKVLITQYINDYSYIGVCKT